MQLIEIKNIPLEYRLRVEEAKLKKIENNEIINKQVQLSENSGKDSEIVKNDFLNFNSSVKPSEKESTAVNENLKKQGLQGTTAAAYDEYTKIKSIIPEQIIRNSHNTADNIIDDDVDLSQLNYNNIVQNSEDAINKENDEYEFVPSDVKMEIINKAEVKIEYIAGYNYVPPSSSPDYDKK